MNFFDKKLKVGLATFFGMIVIILEFGILDGFLFTAEGLSVTFKSIPKSLGYNFCVMSIIIYVLTVAYVAYLGYRKNWAGLVAMVVLCLCPIVGLLIGKSGAGAFNVLFGWGIAHLTPMYVLLGFAGDLTSSSWTLPTGTMLLLAIAVLVIYVVVWALLRLARKSYDAKNPWQF